MQTDLSHAISAANLRFGLPMWFMEAWRGNVLTAGQVSRTALTDYSRAFASVEGNTTFYGLPAAERVRQWQAQVPPHFRFCFKLPRSVSHAADLLQAYAGERSQWQAFCAQLAQQLGVVTLQLPAEFSPSRLSELFDFIALLQQDSGAEVSVELRHSAFFNKGQEEQALLRGLQQLGAGRTVFDSRGLFADASTSDEVRDAQLKKPRMPVHPVATSRAPVVRFIGHSDWQQNLTYLSQWQQKLQQWLAEGRTPYFFIHTAGNTDVQYFVRFIESLWQLPAADWAGENEAGQTEDLFSI